MKHKLKFLLALLGVVMGSAHAGFITTGGTNAGADGQISSIGTCNVSFNDMSAVNNCGASYSGTTTGNFVIGSVPGKYASPTGDSTGYLAVGPSSGSTSITITLNSKKNYFGFLTGSLDTYNLVQFYQGGSLVDSFTGTDINNKAFPNTATNGNTSVSTYVNYFPTIGANQTFFDKVVYSSSGDAFETDNHSFGVAAAPVPVPEPASSALIMLAGLVLFASHQRKQYRKNST